MEEIYDWMSDAEKKQGVIVADGKEIESVKENYGRHKVRICI